MAHVFLISRNPALHPTLLTSLGGDLAIDLQFGTDYPAEGEWDLLLPEIQSLSDWILCLGQLENEGVPVLPICTNAMFTEIVRSGLPLIQYMEFPFLPHTGEILWTQLLCHAEYPAEDRTQALWRRAAWGAVAHGTGYIHRTCDRIGIPLSQRSAVPMYVSVKEIHTSDETPERMSQVADLLSYRLQTLDPEACEQIIPLSPTEFLALFHFPGSTDYTRLRTCAEHLVGFGQSVLCCTACCYVGSQTDISRIRQVTVAMIRQNIDNILNRPVTVVWDAPSKPARPAEAGFAAQQWARYLYAQQFERIIEDVQDTLTELDSVGQLHRDTLEKLVQEFSQFLFITLHDYGVQASELFDTEVYRRLYHLATESVDHTMKWIRYTVERIAGHLRQEYANMDPISRVVSYIDTHLVEDLRADVLAEIAHYSTSYLGRAFRVKIGMTFQEYIRLMRMRFAENLLRDTDLTVSQIAERVGYRSYANFHAQFRQRYHCPPSEYRRRLQSPDAQSALEGS